MLLLQCSRSVGLLLSPARTWAAASTCTGIQSFSAAAAGAVVDCQSDQEFKTALADQTKTIVIDFTAKWCGPCKFIAPHYEEMAKQNPGVTFLKVDIDTPSLSKTVEEHTITGVPTFAIYSAGKMVERFSGAQIDLLKKLVSNIPPADWSTRRTSNSVFQVLDIDRCTVLLDDALCKL
eukprot:CAMPEP_0119105128 /NCGR_PEP_ID=MMETSP1180-20130426/3182_1 /TAXON_ID=3052 ORGANISM="Chlamydomonas cf sp, Strain CCMP681" /NCGR_SAMPLE_ID=MMETSP1180 /ASSEMBLY_ACC=CAM_ASM_000741 /LENGTH=177 /DNA_ID=CAMNT_0007090111 /DNA_START=37 /DNA_END=571 /DNA_ORIENTATION=-